MKPIYAWEAALHAAERVFCLSHPKPDGDAVGALLGIYHTLSYQGKEVTLVLPDAVPSYLRFLPGWDHILIWTDTPGEIQAAARQADIFFCVDFGRWDRIDPSLRDLIDPERLIWVDHHADSEPLSIRWNFWDPTAAATCELLYQRILVRGQSTPLPLPARIALYTGMLTDTGGFRFRSVTPITFQVASQLIAPPFPLEAVHYFVFQRKRLDTLRLHSHLIQTQLRRLEPLPVLLLPVSARVLEEFGATWEDIETLPNQLLALEGTLLVAVLKEYPDSTRISLRSVGDFPCHEVAQRFPVGGGHRNAAGATLYEGLGDAITFVENLIRTEYADSLVEHYRAFLAKLELQKLYG
ncbi:MAG: DHH family phosphoesterase [Bacteroidia bacterium]|nr:DHH family phosphoesterase [Bacteroidia bacterium]